MIRKISEGACIRHSLGTTALGWPGRAAAPPMVVRRLSTNATVWPDPVRALAFLIPYPWSQTVEAGSPPLASITLQQVSKGACRHAVGLNLLILKEDL